MTSASSRKARLFPIGLWLAALVLLAASLGLWWILTAPPPLAVDHIPKSPGDAERGRLVFAAAFCGACHATPGQNDPLRLGGGLALASPFGTFRVPNISSDQVDGIGKWSAIDLARALITGTTPTGAHYYPAFPYTSYTGMRGGDIVDLYAYLKTLPAVKGRPPPHDLPLLFKVRGLIGLWKRLYFTVGGSRAMLNGEPVHDRGAYLSETLGHCAECHATRDSLAAIKPETRFAGGPDPEGTGFVPNITPSRLTGWSEADVAKLLKTGETPRGDRVGSSMADVVSNLSVLPQADRDAIALYVKSLPARPTPQP